MNTIFGPVIGVVGGCGGIGATTFAAVLATVLAPSVLVDLDPSAGGIDVLLAAESQPGPRWSGLRLEGGRLDPGLLADGLPRWRDVAFIAADVAPRSHAAIEVIAAAAELGPVVTDLARGSLDEDVLGRCDLVVLVVGCDVYAVSAARTVVAGIGDRPAGVVVRGGRGLASPDQVADYVGLPLLGVLGRPPTRSDSPLAGNALPRRMVRVAEGVLDGVGDRRG